MLHHKVFDDLISNSDSNVLHVINKNINALEAVINENA